jgi:hypothetical protein
VASLQIGTIMRRSKQGLYRSFEGGQELTLQVMRMRTANGTIRRFHRLVERYAPNTAKHVATTTEYTTT